jgi:hypothetical protein
LVLSLIVNNEEHLLRSLADTGASSSIILETLIEVYMSANEQQTLRDEYSRATKILDAEYKPASLDDVIKICENLHLEEQHQLKILLQKYEHQVSV